MIYPTPLSAQAYAQALIAKHSHVSGLPARAEKAAAIVPFIDVDIDKWIVPSQTGKAVYTVTATGCTCPDYARAPQLGTALHYCKHMIAVAILKRWIVEQLATRTLHGETASNRRIVLAQANGDEPMIHLIKTYSETTGHHLDTGRLSIPVKFSPTLDAYIPSNDAAYIQAIRWLEDASPVKRILPESYSYAREIDPPITQWQPSATTIAIVHNNWKPYAIYGYA